MSTSAPERLDDLEAAIAAPAARRRDPFVHIFDPPWRRLFSRVKIREGDRALCGFVARRSDPGLPVYREWPHPVCPRCEVIHGRRW